MLQIPMVVHHGALKRFSVDTSPQFAVPNHGVIIMQFVLTWGTIRLHANTTFLVRADTGALNRFGVDISDLGTRQ